MKKSNTSDFRSREIIYLGLLLSISLLLTTTSDAAKPAQTESDIDLGGGFVENMGFVSAGDTGVGFTNETIRHMAVSIGQLGGVNPETGEVIFNEGNLLPLVAQELDVTGPAFFYTNVYIAGDTVVYGAFYGSGTGISNIPVANITGSMAERPEIQAVLDNKLDADGVWDAIVGNTSGVSDLQQVVFILNSATPSWDTAYLWGNHADAGYADFTETDLHFSATNNPHQLYADEIGALPKTGGKITGNIDMGGTARITHLPPPVNDDDAVTRSYLDRRLNYIDPQGDIGMGIYTNYPEN